MFGTYLQLRIKSCFRLLKGIGVIRSCILLLILALAIKILVAVEDRWVLPLLCVLLLGGYHNNRKDRSFLALQLADLIPFLRKEYFLLGSFFLLATLLKSAWWDVTGLSLFLWFLPYLKEMKLKRNVIIRLPFLYRGGMEYIRMFRQCWPIYLILLFCFIMGIIHDNVQLAKVCLMTWCLTQTTALSVLPDKLQIITYSSYKQFCSILLQMTCWNVLVTGLPFYLLLIVFVPGTDVLYFSGFYTIGSILYLINLGLVRQTSISEISLILFQIVIMIPLFLFSCFIPYLLSVFAFITALISYLVMNRLKHIWN